MRSGPTQNYQDRTLGSWRPHPTLAAVVRLTLVTLPALAAVTFGVIAVTVVPPGRLGMHPALWLVGQLCCSTALVVVTTRLARRLMPLSALLRMTLYFPDRAPSRLAVARRAHSPAAVRAHLTGSAGQEGTDQASVLLGLVAALTAHDRTTAAHSERVQAYAALIAQEMGLGEADTASLGWAALLHDVGKLDVPQEILAHSGRPTDEQWEVLVRHPSAGARRAADLREHLGQWFGAIEQHHERWDGRGYPAGLAGTQISLAARVVAVADAFDVITSARAYKAPLSPAAARDELARCAGQQFDPDVVRAFLQVGLGRLRTVAGPLSVLSGLPVLRSLPAQELPAAGALLAPALPAATAVVLSSTVGGLLMLAGAAPAPAADGGAIADGQVVGLPDDRRRAAADDVAGGGDGAGGAPSTRPPADEAPAAPDDTRPGRQQDEAGDATSDPVTGEDAGTEPRPGPEPGRTTAGSDGASGDASSGVDDHGPRPSTTPAPRPPGGEAPPAPAPARPTPGPGIPGSSPAPTPTAAAPAPPPPPALPAPPPAPPPPSPTPTPADPLSEDCRRATAGDRRLGGLDLRGCSLTGVDLRGADLAGARMDGARLDGVDLSGAQLTGASLAGATITGSTFDGARLTGATFDRATVTGSRFVGAVTNRSTFAGATMVDCVF